MRAVLIFALLQGCATSPPPELPAQAADVPPCAEPRFSLGPRADFTPLAVAKVDSPEPIPSVERAPEMCETFARRKTTPRCPKTRQGTLAIVDAALRKDIEARDADLAAIERCSGLPAGAVRALRAELAPRSCRDVVAEPAMRATTDPEIAALLRAQTIEGRLERAALRAPEVPFDAVDRYVAKSLLPWLLETLTFLEELDRAAPSSGAGRAIVTLARGRALLRLATVARGAVDQKPACDKRTRGPAPLCPPAAKPARLSFPYLSDLGDELEQKGHGALRQGLRELAESGIIDDGRGHEAAARLANQRKRSGPPPLTEVIAAPPPAEIAGLTGRLARALPVTLVPAFLALDGSADITVMDALAARGQPGAWAAPPESLSRELALSAGRARLALALRYQRRADVESAVAYAQSVDGATLGAADRAWMATAVGLRAAMGGEAPPDGPLAPLAVVAASEGDAASLARFNLEVLAVNARRRARLPISPGSCRAAWDAVRKAGASIEQRAWVDWCVHASDAWAAVPQPALCRSP